MPILIKVDVAGAPRSGKSTIAKLIADAINNAGIACEVDDGYDNDYGKWQNDKLAAIKKNGSLLVKIQTHREGNENTFSGEKVKLYDW